MIRLADVPDRARLERVDSADDNFSLALSIDGQFFGTRFNLTATDRRVLMEAIASRNCDVLSFYTDLLFEWGRTNGIRPDVFMELLTDLDDRWRVNENV